MRMGITCPTGKLTCEARCWVSPEADEGLTALAALSGVPKSEYLRNVIMTWLYGHLGLAKIRQGGSSGSAG